jgi:hypothetical protein
MYACLEMTIQVRVSGDSWVFNPTGAYTGANLHLRVSPAPDLNKVGFRRGFIWHPCEPARSIPEILA